MVLEFFVFTIYIFKSNLKELLGIDSRTCERDFVLWLALERPCCPPDRGAAHVRRETFLFKMLPPQPGHGLAAERLMDGHVKVEWNSTIDA